jgi:hypothetical protein
MVVISIFRHLPRSAYSKNSFLLKNGVSQRVRPKKKSSLNVRLKSSDSSAQQRATNYTNVGVAQGIAYVDLVSSSLRCLAPSRIPRRTVRQHLKVSEGQLVTSVAMGVDVLARLHQQIQQVLVRLREVSRPKPNAKTA